MYYMLINKLTSKPGKRAKMLEILIASGKVFEDNDSCIMSSVSQDSADENVIWVQDIWTTKAAHKAAMQDELIQANAKQSIPLLEEMPEQHEVEYAGGKLGH